MPPPTLNSEEPEILGVAAVMCYARRGVVSQCRRTNHAATAAVK